MSLSDLGAFVSLASFVQQLGENCYRASHALEQFNSNLTIVRRRCTEWQERARKYGLLSDQQVVEALQEAEEELRKEETRLENLQRSLVHRCWFKLRGTAFPLQLGESLQRIVNLDEKILSNWRAQETGDAEAQKKADQLGRARSFAFRRDNRYVRLPIIEKEIKDALETPDGTSRVVLLHGPPGTGKSCMARNLALQYEATSIATTFTAESSTSLRASNKRKRDKHSRTHFVSSPTALDSCYGFEKVLYLDCGDQVDLRAKQEEMLDGLGLIRGPIEPGVNPEPEVNLRGLLRQFLKERRILIVLDDVWDKAFLEGIQDLCGQHVRILVTSQRSRLCDSSHLEQDVTSISMDRITKETAKDILKVHTGFCLEDQIAGPIQACMDTLVERVYMNPHALASIATAIDHRRAHQLVEWQNAINEYDDLMAAPNTMNIHGISNPSSFDKAFQIKHSRLGDQERKLMILLTMMQGPHVPESVVQLFFNEFVASRRMGIHRSSTQFSKCRKRLEDLQCVNIEETESQNLWSIHFLDKYFIQKIMENEICSMHKKVQDLPNMIQGRESKPQVHFLKLLGALYFGGEWRRHVAGDLLLEGAKLSSLTKTAIQPITSLMMRNVDEDWSTVDQLSADQVIISYIVDGVIHENAAKTLLGSPVAKGTFCDVILSMVKISDMSLSENIIIGMLDRFEDMEVSENSSKAKLNQCRFLCDLATAGGYENRHLLRFSLCRVERILSILTKNLSPQEKDSSFEMFSALTLGWLAVGESPSCDQDRKSLLVDTPLLERLIRCIWEPNQEEETSGTITQLCSASPVDQVLLEHHRQRMENLVEATSDWFKSKIAKMGRRHFLQECGAFALACIVCDNYQTSLKVFNFPAFNVPSALTSLLYMLSSPYSNKDLCELRSYAGQALAHMMVNISPLSEDEAKRNGPKIQETSYWLAKLLNQGPDIPTDVRDHAVLALASIAPEGIKSVALHSAAEFRSSGRRLVQLGYVQDGLLDLEEALHLDEQDAHILSALSFAKTKLDDWEVALRYANAAVERTDSKDPFTFQERGVLKHMMGDLSGALSDLDASLELDSNDYESLKHRAYVKFLMHDETGAVADAEKALQRRPTRYHLPSYENSCLGTSAVEFLNFRL